MRNLLRLLLALCILLPSILADAEPLGGLIDVPELEPVAGTTGPETGVRIPDHFDWRGHRCSPPVRSQGGCGSCWAFAGTTALSSRWCLADPDHNYIRFSPQWHVNNDKSTYYTVTNRGCSGGHYLALHLYTNDIGTVADSCAPYVGRDQGRTSTCADGSAPKFYKFGVQTRHPRSNLAAVQEAIMLHGPVPVAFSAYSGIYSASSNGLDGGRGIYQRSESETFRYGHAVVLLGWGTAANGVPYWICMNSWGTRYHDNGVFYIRRGTNECSIESYPASTLPVFTGTPTPPENVPETRIGIDKPEGGFVVKHGERVPLRATVLQGAVPTEARVLLVGVSNTKRYSFRSYAPFSEGVYDVTYSISSFIPVGSYKFVVEPMTDSSEDYYAESEVFSIVAETPGTLAPVSTPVYGASYACRADGSADIIHVTWHSAGISAVTLTLLRSGVAVKTLGTVGDSGEANIAVPCGVNALPSGGYYAIRVSDPSGAASSGTSSRFSLTSPETHISGSVSTPSLTAGERTTVLWSYSVTPSWASGELPERVRVSLDCGSVFSLGIFSSSSLPGAAASASFNVPEPAAGSRCTITVAAYPSNDAVPLLRSNSILVNAADVKTITLGSLPSTITQLAPLRVCWTSEGISETATLVLYSSTGVHTRLATRLSSCTTVYLPGSIPPGSYVLRVRTDSSSAYSDAPIAVVAHGLGEETLPEPTLSTPDPTIRGVIVSPTAAEHGDAITVRWDAEDATAVVIRLDGTSLGTYAAAAEVATVTVPASASIGEHTVTVEVADRPSSIASARLTVVETATPPPSFAVVAPGAGTTVQLGGEARVVIRCASTASNIAGTILLKSGSRTIGNVTPVPAPAFCDTLSEYIDVTVPSATPVGDPLHFEVVLESGGVRRTATSPIFTAQDSPVASCATDAACLLTPRADEEHKVGAMIIVSWAFADSSSAQARASSVTLSLQMGDDGTVWNSEITNTGRYEFTIPALQARRDYRFVLTIDGEVFGGPEFGIRY